MVAGVFLHDRVLIDRMRTIAFALLTPFFFLRAGLLISAPALLAGAGVIALLFVVKIATKLIGVWPMAAVFGVEGKERTYTTLLMATGLTFGSISPFGLTPPSSPGWWGGVRVGVKRFPPLWRWSPFGSFALLGPPNAHYSELVTLVILSAFDPTLIAQRLFLPEVVDAEEEDVLSAEDVSIVHRRAAG